MAEAPDGARPVSGEVALAYSRIARAVRLSLALQARVLSGEPVHAARGQDAEPAHDPTYGITRENHPYILLGAYKKAVKHVVGDQIAAETTDGVEAERLTLALYERLYEHDDDAVLVGLPIGELINPHPRRPRDAGPGRALDRDGAPPSSARKWPPSTRLPAKPASERRAWPTRAWARPGGEGRRRPSHPTPLTPATAKQRRAAANAGAQMT